jgi:hypothetical protein
MHTGTGVLSVVLAVSALFISAANSKNAEARSSHPALNTFKGGSATAASLERATIAKGTLSAAATSSAATTASTRAALQGEGTEPVTAATLDATPALPAAERISPPHLLENRGLRRMRKAEISPAMLQVAAQIVRRHYAKPVGTEVTVEVEGKQVVARIERHFHPEGGPVKPWGFHPGVSLFIAR